MLLRVGIPDSRAAHRAEENGIAASAERECRFADRDTFPLDSCLPDERFFERERVAKALTDGAQHTHCLRCHLRTDAVPRKHGNMILAHDLLRHSLRDLSAR